MVDDLRRGVELRPGRMVSWLELPAESSVVVLFLHGALANLMQFEAQLARLRDRVACVAYDAFGCGARYALKRRGDASWSG